MKRAARLAAASLLCAVAAIAQAQLKPTGPGTSPLPPTDPVRRELQAMKELAALTAAEQWLTLLDAGDFAKAWEECSSLFRERVPREKWLEGMPATRKPFGAMKSRRHEVASYKTALPGVPNGEYVTVRFSTTFEKKADVEELMTLVLDKGVWRTTGYSIR